MARHKKVNLPFYLGHISNFVCVHFPSAEECNCRVYTRAINLDTNNIILLSYSIHVALIKYPPTRYSLGFYIRKGRRKRQKQSPVGFSTRKKGKENRKKGKIFPSWLFHTIKRRKEKTETKLLAWLFQTKAKRKKIPAWLLQTNKQIRKKKLFKKSVWVHHIKRKRKKKKDKNKTKNALGFPIQKKRKLIPPDYHSPIHDPPPSLN